MYPEAPPTIVAEALRLVPDAWATALRVGPPAPAARVAAAMARALAPEAADVAAPDWLLPRQHGTFTRAIAALRRFRGALIAEPVGSGKTYIALAVAGVLGRRGAVCFVPASLRAQWQATAGRLDVPVVVWSHAMVSRGRFPPGDFGFAVVDESHHYRNPTILRYGHLARWLRGRPTLLLTATPIVNRAADLIHQLLLAVRDDALRGAGLASLAAAGDEGDPHPALGHVVIIGNAPTGADRPPLRVQSLPAGAGEIVVVDDLGRSIRALTLARHPAVADLLRGVFWRALGSSLAAVRAAVVRYRHLLLHARDAEQCHRRVSRRALKRFLVGFEAQLVLWPLLPDLDGGIDLTTEDGDRLEDLFLRITALVDRGDPKLDRLGPLVRDGVPTLVFVNFVETLHAIRRLPGAAVAWCTGAEAGIGALRQTREGVLRAFGTPAAPRDAAPAVLVTTDVLAEGLDLQRAGRVIHFDLPWTPVRLDQRNGRAARSGSPHATVEIVRFEPPPLVEEAVRGVAILTRKASVARRMGIGEGVRHGWRWRSSLADAFPGEAAPGGVARVGGGPRGVLLGVTMRGHPRLVRGGNVSAPMAGLGTVVWLDADGWTEDPGVVSVRLFEASECPPSPAPERSEVDAALARAAPAIGVLARRWAAGRWASTPRRAAARRFLCRLRALAVRAARARDASLLGAVDTALDFAAGGHTAGEALLVESLAVAEEADVIRRLHRLPTSDPPVDRLRVEVTGLLLFDGCSR